MSILFLGCLYRKEQENELLANSRIGISNAVNTFQWNLIGGLEKQKNIDIINVVTVGTYPKYYKKLMLKSLSWMHNSTSNDLEIGSINLPFLKQYIRYRKVKKELKKRLVDNNTEHILIYSTYMPFLKAVYKLSREIKVTLIVTDLPEFYDLNKTSSYRRFLREMNNKMVYKFLERIDNFVLLTEEMKYPLKVNNRPYVVIEGIVPKKPEEKELEKQYTSNKKSILYTGTLHYQFGIKRLLDAFSLISDEDYELWICGAGEAEEEIKELSKKDNRIKFFGYVTTREARKLQQQATVLVNPRTAEGEYTKYSFPSKTMEYLLSGKPVIMYKLPGIPEEYDEYLYYFEEESITSMKKRLIEVCELNENEREVRAREAIAFVLEYKNNEVQGNKILKMINK